MAQLLPQARPDDGQETESVGLSALVAANKDALAADMRLTSDGPRCQAAVPTLATGTRGSFHFDLRPGGVHSDNWAC